MTDLGLYLQESSTRVQAPWLEADTPAEVRGLIVRALKDVGILETAPNRSPRIDSYNLAAGAPIGSYWCASACGAWWRESGYDVPIGYASCDNWMNWAKRTSRWSDQPSLGSAVLYGKPGDAKHIGLIIRLQPVVLSVEGNTTIEGSAFEPNGTAVALKKVAPPDPILGYVALQSDA